MNTSFSQTKTEAVGLEINQLCKSYNGQQVLEDISLKIKPGELFVIMGPSGSGKSVLLRQIIGLEAPDSGEILIDGLCASNPKTHQAVSSAMLFQSGALLNSLTVFDNLALYLREHELYSKEIVEERVMGTLALLNLQNAAQKFPSELSGGMRKRVAIARTLMMQPRLILFDEPTSELDPIMSATIAEVIGTLNRELQVTCIVVTHDRHVALSIGERAAMLVGGKISSVGDANALSESDDSQIQEFMNPKVNIDRPRFNFNPNYYRKLPSS